MKTKLIAEWKIQVRDREGKLLKQLCKDGDLITLNWKKLASAFGLVCGNWKTLYLVREDGSTYTPTVYWWHNSLANSGAAGRSAIIIVVGSGTAPPSETDYRLQNKWGDSGEIPITVTNPSPEEWVLTATKTFSTVYERVLAEVGVKWVDSIYNAHYLICRDVLPEPITIPAGGSVTITYTLKSRSGG
jgi:hypothetical protein